MRQRRKLSITLLAVAAALAGFWLGRTNSVKPEDAARWSRLEQENQKLQSELEKLRAESSLPPDPSGPVSQGRPPAQGPRKADNRAVEISEQLRIAQEDLAAARQSLSALQSAAKELQAQLDQAREEIARGTARESSLAGQLASTEQLAEARGADLNRKNEQLALLESGQKKLREESAVSAQKASQQLQILNELQDIYRRRESYMNTLTARYREVTEQYRAFASVLENRRGPEGTSGSGISIAGPELGRIQNSIAMAEEDLRQLSTLNAQVLRLQKKLPVK